MNRIILVMFCICMLYTFPWLILVLGGFLIACLIFSRAEDKADTEVENKENKDYGFETYEDRIKKNLDEVDWPEESEEDKELAKKWNAELEKRRRIEEEKFRREQAGE